MKHHFVSVLLLQLKALNAIALGPSDNIKRRITISSFLFILSKQWTVIWDLVNLSKFDHNNQMITLLVITLSGFHCICTIWGHFWMTRPRRAPLYRVVIILLSKKNSMKDICSRFTLFCILVITICVLICNVSKKNSLKGICSHEALFCIRFITICVLIRNVSKNNSL